MTNHEIRKWIFRIEARLRLHYISGALSEDLYFRVLHVFNEVLRETL